MTPEEQASLDSRLIEAAFDGRTGVVKKLLAAGADVHAHNDWALCWAAWNGHTKMVQILLAAGADVHTQDDKALRDAAVKGHTETVQVLQKALKNEQAQRLELVRQQNPLSAGTGLSFAKSRAEDVEILLRDAIAEQSSPGRPDRREYASLPLCPW